MRQLLVLLSLGVTACVPCAPLAGEYERELGECLDKYPEDREAAKLCGQRVNAAYIPRLRMCHWW